MVHVLLETKYFSKKHFERHHHHRQTLKAVSSINACILWNRFVMVCFLSLDVGTCLWPKEINMIGQIASTGSLFPLLHDLSLSTANSGSSHRTPDCINILYRTHRDGCRADVVCHTAQTPPAASARFGTF